MRCYFTDVKIPDVQRLGAVNDGWNVSLTTLMNERMSIGAGVSTGFPELFEFCKQPDAGGWPCDRRSQCSLEAGQLGGEGERG